MQAIRTTKYSGALVRMHASTQAGGKYYPWDDALSEEENHARTARAHASHMGDGWQGRVVGAGYRDPKALRYYWVTIPHVWAFSARRHTSGGNTYHRVSISRDGEHLLTTPSTYGYGEQYRATAIDALIDRGFLPCGARESSLKCASWDVADVAKKSDL